VYGESCHRNTDRADHSYTKRQGALLIYVRTLEAFVPCAIDADHASIGKSCCKKTSMKIDRSLQLAFLAMPIVADAAEGNHRWRTTGRKPGRAGREQGEQAQAMPLDKTNKHDRR
jgi:hypothetical protein